MCCACGRVCALFTLLLLACDGRWLGLKEDPVSALSLVWGSGCVCVCECISVYLCVCVGSWRGVVNVFAWISQCVLVVVRA